MTPAGLLVMLFSVGTVTSLFSWCIYKVLTSPGESDKLHAVELHTPDMDQPD
ncbi:MAG: hypothetical protein LDL31_01420 [Prosthecobacter sp.]|jgi:hypothetical protein|nr:hypothetical protein [Prosthecobacter sp.]